MNWIKEISYEEFTKSMEWVIKVFFWMVVVGIVLNEYYPEFLERFPYIYGWFDGCIRLWESCFKAIIFKI